MNALLFFFAGGAGFWWGVAVVMAGVVAALLFPAVAGAKRIGIEILLMIGGGLIFMSGPPFGRGIYFLWVVVVITCIVTLQPRIAIRPRIPALACTGLLAFAGTLALAELPFAREPRLPPMVDRPAFVLGDSLSSGIGRERRTWPEILNEDHGWPILNLAKAGARLREGLSSQILEVEGENAVIFLMIGGNDVIRRTPPDRFEDELERLITTLVRQERILVLVELPFIPGYRPYARAQRAAAKRHRVIIIPRRYLASILANPDLTLDGLHFSDAGHEEWAELVRQLSG